jgi:hypothetical protein
VSAHGRAGPSARGPQPDGPPPVLWALLVIAAALVGGLAAAALVHASLIVAMIVGVVAGGIAVAVFRSSGRPAEWPPGDRPGPWPPAEHDGTSAARSRPAPSNDDPASPAATVPVSPVVSPGSAVSPSPPVSPGSAVSPGSEVSPVRAETVVQLLPAQPGRGHARLGADKSWWDAAQGAPPPPSPGAQRAPAPDLSTYLASTFIAQCPRCGAFLLDFRRARSGWDFRCESCEYIWTWQPGSPWPPVRVAPERRRE